MGRVVIGAFCVCGLAGSATVAQSYEPGPYTVDGGGGVLLGATYTLSGTVGQPDAGGALKGPSYGLTGGFWYGNGEAGCVADLAAPFGILDFSDIISFLTAFGAMQPEADLSAPAGVWDFSDVLMFLTVFGAGCP